MNINTGGTEVTGTNYTTETITTSTVTIRVRATTGTYFSVPAVSETLTVRGNAILCKYSVYTFNKVIYLHLQLFCTIHMMK